MLIYVLGIKVNTMSNKRLMEELKNHGHQARFIRPIDCIIRAGDPSEIWHQGEKLKKPDMVLLWSISTKATSSSFEYYVALHFELMGSLIVNSIESKRTVSNKFTTTQILAQSGVPVPPTYLVNNVKHLETIVEQDLQMPIVLKTRGGTWGRGVMLVDSIHSARSVFDTLIGFGKIVQVQKYIPQGEYDDIRAFVIGDEVAGAIRRINRKRDKEFRSNVHLGAEPQSTYLTEEYKAIAVQAANVCGLQVAGVDMIDTDTGPYVIEVNSCPSFEVHIVAGIPLVNEYVTYLEFLKTRKF